MFTPTDIDDRHSDDPQPGFIDVVGGWILVVLLLAGLCVAGLFVG